MALQTAPIAIVTRMGIGVYDPQWWKARLALFEALTLPSLMRFRVLDITWTLLLDTDIPRDALTQLHKLVEHHSLKFIRFQFVPNNSFVLDAFSEAFRSRLRPGKRMIALLIDDDDAVAEEIFSNSFEILNEKPSTSQVVSFSQGCALNAPEQTIGSLRYRSHRSNTVLFGTDEELSALARRSHVVWLKEAEKAGLLAHEAQDLSEQFLYTFHQQGDGNYDDRVARVKDWRPLDGDMIAHFGINEQRLREWNDIQKEMPPTLGLTWRRTQSEQDQIGRLYRSMQRTKSRLVDTNSRLFDREIPFFYVLTSSSSNFTEGMNSFHGVATPGATVRISRLNNQNEWEVLNEVHADLESGIFTLKPELPEGKSKILFELLIDSREPAEKNISYTVKVVAMNERTGDSPK